MRLKDTAAWEEFKKNNTDPYGGCILNYAEAWADEMERQMDAGAKLEDIAAKTSNDVDKRAGFGITGFMFGAAVSVLTHCWEHGEALRQWRKEQGV